jgi:hypothetical protein
MRGWLSLLVAPIHRALVDRIEKRPELPQEVAATAREPYFEVEEALANGLMLRQAHAEQPAAACKRLLTSVRRQPPGYRDGEAAATDEGFAAAVSQTFRGYLSVWSSLRGLDPSNPALDFLRLLRWMRRHAKRAQSMLSMTLSELASPPARSGSS